jgi:hypothetical protein
MIAFGTLAVALLLSPRPRAIGADLGRQEPSSILQTFFPQQTGENGMEEYLRAMDLMNDGVNSVYKDDPSDPYGIDTPASRAEKARLSEQLGGLDYLGRQRVFVNRYSRVYDLIVQGNTKPCSAPAAANVAPKGLTTAVRIAALVQARAYCESADGKQSQCLDTLLCGITFSLRSGSVNTMAYLSDVLGERTLFDAFLEQLPRMSLADANRISAYVDQAIQEPPMTVALIEHSAAVHEIMLRGASVTDAVANGGPNEFPEYRQRLSGASDSEKSQFVDAVRAKTQAAYRVQSSALGAPESSWYDVSASWKTDFGPRKVSSSDSLDDLAESMSRELVPSFRNMVITELRRRAQLRLLGLHARILAYRWHQHKLPATLSDAVESQASFDPLSGEPFVYELKPDGTYALYSKGRPETGVVELHYTAPPGTHELEP